MWNDDELDKAHYVTFKNGDGGQFLNVGTIEIRESVYQGPYFITPAPPFGSLKNGVGQASGLHGVHVPARLYREAHWPSSWPLEPRAADTVILHQYGNGDV